MYFIQDFERLKQGGLFVKYGLKSMFGPQIRFISVSPDLKFFCWASYKGDKPKTQLPVSEITNVTLGRQSPNFKYYKLPSNMAHKANLCFSIYFQKRSVDLEASSEEICKNFYNDFVKLIQLNNPAFNPGKIIGILFMLF